jgi:hypothetical protein
MLVKLHKSYRLIVAICDKELIGKKFFEGEMQLDLTGGFFKGEEKTPEEVQEIILDAVREDASFNIVGKKSCELAKKMGLVKSSGIRKIQGIPIALILI